MSLQMGARFSAADVHYVARSISSSGWPFILFRTVSYTAFATVPR
jgi:hypothetical protein